VPLELFRRQTTDIDGALKTKVIDMYEEERVN
jgi:hypothetical protein